MLGGACEGTWEEVWAGACEGAWTIAWTGACEHAGGLVRMFGRVRGLVLGAHPFFLAA